MAKHLLVDASDNHSLQENLPIIQSVLKQGKVIAFPTDTLYGLGADPTNPEGLKQLFEIKRRPLDKPILILVSSPEEIQPWVTEPSDFALKAMEHFWPGPLTLVFNAHPSVSPFLTAGTGKLGIRCPDNPFTLSLLKALDHPLTAPSANLSGESAPMTAEEVIRNLGPWIDLVLDTGPSTRSQVSSVLDTTTDPPSWLREGAIPHENIEATLNIKLQGVEGP